MSNGKSLTVEERLSCLQALRKVGDGVDLHLYLPWIYKGIKSGLLTQQMADAAVNRYFEVSPSVKRDRERGIICWLPSEVL